MLFLLCCFPGLPKCIYKVQQLAQNSIDCHQSNSALLLKAAIPHMFLVLPFWLVLNAPTHLHEFIIPH